MQVNIKKEVDIKVMPKTCGGCKYCYEYNEDDDWGPLVSHHYCALLNEDVNDKKLNDKCPLKELKLKPVQVSYSRIECFKKCAYQYKLRYIDKLKTYFDGDPANALIIGTALHTGLEKNVTEAIDWYYNQYPIIDDKHIEEAIKLEYVIKKCKEQLPEGGICELKIECDDFVGYIDRLVEVEPNVYDLYDYKYSNNHDNYVNNSGQLHVYKYYFEKLNPGKKIRDMYFLFAPKVAIRMKYKNKTNKRDETLEEFRRRLKSELESKDALLVKVEYNPSKVEEFKASTYECLSCNDYKKSPTKLCDWCEFKDLCHSENTLNIDWEKSGKAKEENDNMQLPANQRRSTKPSDKKKIWLYGAPFSGKTYLANQFPDPLMLNTDGNVKYVDAPYIAIKNEVKVEGRRTETTLAWSIFKDAIAELEKKQNDFKTIIVDLLEDTYEFCRLYMYDKLGITHESDDSFRAWDKVRTEYLSTIKRLMALDYDNIILISHEDTSKDITKKGGDKITAIKPNLNDKAALKIAGMVDLVARVINDEDKRTISFKSNEVIFGGGRLGIKAEAINCSYDELMKVYKVAVGEASTSELAPTSTPRRARGASEEPKQEVVEETKVEQVVVEQVVETTQAPTEVETSVVTSTPSEPTRKRVRVTSFAAPKVEEPKQEEKVEEKLPTRRARTPQPQPEAPKQEEASTPAPTRRVRTRN